MDKVKKLAVLIDADNALHKTIGLVLQEVAKYGMPVIKRVYGDWSSEISENGKLANRLFVWRDVSLSYAITPIQQFAYTKGKDATDMMLIINAMDLLHDNHLDGFCIVSSDSDFTPLASRIRESGLMVYGFGEKKTPKAFINACDKFIYIENLTDNNSDNDELNSIVESKLDKIDNKPNDDLNIEKTQLKSENAQIQVENTAQKPTAIPNQEVKVDDQTLQLIYKAIKENTDDDGFANLSTLGNYLIAVKPDFDTRNYGRAKLSGLLQALDLFEIQERGTQKFVRKRKGFGEFLKIVEKVMRNSCGAGDFIEIDMLAKWVKYGNYVSADEYGFDNVDDMLKSINSKYFELNADKTQIRLLK